MANANISLGDKYYGSACHIDAGRSMRSCWHQFDRRFLWCELLGSWTSLECNNVNMREVAKVGSNTGTSLDAIFSTTDANADGTFRELESL